jgi:hypothetical protein
VARDVLERALLAALELLVQVLEPQDIVPLTILWESGWYTWT